MNPFLLGMLPMLMSVVGVPAPVAGILTKLITAGPALAEAAKAEMAGKHPLLDAVRQQFPDLFPALLKMGAEMLPEQKPTDAAEQVARAFYAPDMLSPEARAKFQAEMAWMDHASRVSDSH